MKFAEAMMGLAFRLPNWLYGKELMVKFFFMYMMINAMHHAHVKATTLEA